MSIGSLVLNLSTIVLPVDFSPRCAGMLVYAKALASRYHSQVTLINIINRVLEVSETWRPDDGSPVPPRVVAEHESKLAVLANTALEGCDVRRTVLEGDPEEQIKSLIKREPPSLLVMSTHGNRFRQFFLGSLAAQLLDDVSCPVLTGAHVEHHVAEPSISFRRVLCAIDLNEKSYEVVTWAASFASDFSAELALLHVNSGGAQSADQIKTRLRDLLTQALLKSSTLDPAAVSILVHEGDIAQTVASFAATIRADILIIGRGLTHSARLRRHASPIIRLSPCPVISI